MAYRKVYVILYMAPGDVFSAEDFEYIRSGMPYITKFRPTNAVGYEDDDGWIWLGDSDLADSVAHKMC